MDKFVTKSPVNSDEKSLKRKGNNYDKQYDAKKWKRNFQLSSTTQTHGISNVMSSFVYYRQIMQNGLCQTFTIRVMGQPLHPAGLVTFTYHLPRDKFCKKYLSDPASQSWI